MDQTAALQQNQAVLDFVLLFLWLTADTELRGSVADMPGAGGQYQVTRTRLSLSLYSLTESGEGCPEDEEAAAFLHLTPLQKLTAAMCKDERTIKELIVGRRVGFYKVRGEIGYGTFSRVKLAFHALTKGKQRVVCWFSFVVCLDLLTL